MSAAPHPSRELHVAFLPGAKKKRLARKGVVFFMRHERYLRDPTYYYQSIWTPARALDISSRDWPDYMTLIYDYEEHIRGYNGEFVAAPQMETFFGTDPGSWFRKFLETDASREAPALIRNKREESLAYLPWIDVFLDIWAFDNDEPRGRLNPPALRFASR